MLNFAFNIETTGEWKIFHTKNIFVIFYKYKLYFGNYYTIYLRYYSAKACPYSFAKAGLVFICEVYA